MKNPMHRYGLKLWSTNVEMIDEAQRLFDNDVYNYIELFVVPGSAATCLSAWQSLDIPTVLHAPHSYAGLNMSLRDNESKNRDMIGETEQFRQALSPKNTIFHPGIGGTVEETICQIVSFKGQYEELFASALIENKPRIGLQGESCVGSTPEDVERIMSSTGVGFCLDIGHAIYASVAHERDAFEMLDAFMRLEPSMYHISDGLMDSPKDMHLRFGEGNFPLKRIMNNISDASLVTIETSKDLERTLADYDEDVQYIKNVSSSCAISLREVTPDDCDLVRKWANDTVTREASFTTSAISREDHAPWFSAKLEDSGCQFFIAEDRSGTPVGQVRIDDEKGEGVISVSVAGEFRGMSLGRGIIERATRRYFRSTGAQVINAYIKEDNPASIKVFRNAGYQLKDNLTVKGQKSVHMVIGRRTCG